MTRFDEPEALAGASLTYISARFNTTEGNTVDGSTNGVSVPVPAGSGAYIYPVSDKLKLGISMQNYFGLTVDWNDEWVGRYSSVDVVLLAPQIQPTVAYKVNDWLSVGAGAGLTLGYLSDKMRVESLEPGGSDGKLTLSDSDFAVQGNFGVMIEPSAKTRIGLRYLTETDLDADFRDTWHFGVGAEYQYQPRLLLTGGIFCDTSMSSDRTRPITLPLGNLYRYGVGFKYKASDTMTYGGGFTFLWEGNLPIKETKGVEGHYHKTSISFLSFYAMWH